MKIKSRVTKFGKERKIVEIPKPIRDNFNVGDKVHLEKVDWRGGENVKNKHNYVAFNFVNYNRLWE